MRPVITRLAPTPSGYLHTGNIFNFLYGWLLARAAGGRVLLRIDDLDKERRRDEYVQDIFETLDWLGMDWDLGPTSPDNFYKNWSQESRIPLYNELLDELVKREHIFACTCSRKTLAELGATDRYPDVCLSKNVPLDAPDVAWRVKVPEGTVITFEDGVTGPVVIDLHATQGSFVVRRRDGIPAYQIASLADDLHFGVTTLARGQDLLESTACQLYLAKLLNKETFAQTSFYHHGLLEAPDGNKLSKSAGSVSVKYQRDMGLKPEMLFVQFSNWLGMPRCESLTELLDGWRKRKG